MLTWRCGRSLFTGSGIRRKRRRVAVRRPKGTTAVHKWAVVHQHVSGKNLVQLLAFEALAATAGAAERCDVWVALSALSEAPTCFKCLSAIKLGRRSLGHQTGTSEPSRSVVEIIVQWKEATQFITFSTPWRSSGSYLFYQMASCSERRDRRGTYVYCILDARADLRPA